VNDVFFLYAVFNTENAHSVNVHLIEKPQHTTGECYQYIADTDSITTQIVTSSGNDCIKINTSWLWKLPLPWLVKQHAEILHLWCNGSSGM